MRNDSLHYWSRGNSTDLTTNIRYQSEYSPVQNPSSLRKDCKVSPRMHKLNDSERSYLPAQSYQRLCKRISTPAILHNDENMFSTVPVNSNNEGLKLKQSNTASSKTISSTKKSILKSPQQSCINQSEAESYYEKSAIEESRGIYKTPRQAYQRNEDYGECLSPKPTWTKKLSPRGNVSPFNEFSSVNTHLLMDGGRRRETFHVQRGDGGGFCDQQLTFRTNTQTMTETDEQTSRFNQKSENKMKMEYMSDGKRQWKNEIRRIESKNSNEQTEYNKDYRDDGIRSRQKSIQWTPKEKIVGSIDVLSCARALFQSAKTERGNIQYKQEQMRSDYYEDGESSRLKEMIMELKKQVNQKQTEIMNVKHKTKTIKIHNEELDERLNQAVMAKKRSDDILEQISQRIACNEREMQFLNKCKERLIEVLPNKEDGNDIRKYLKKVDEYRAILDKKEQEAKKINLEVQKLEHQSLGRIASEKSEGRVEIRKLTVELKVRTEEIKQLKEALEKTNAILKMFEKVGQKMIDLETNQNHLIIENDRLKNLLPEQEKEKFQKYLDAKAEASRVIQTSTVMNVIDEYAKNLTKIFEAMSKGKEPSLELFALSKNNKTKKSIGNIDKTTLSKNIDLKELTKTNAEVSEVVYHKFIKYMDEICDQYARACGNRCNIQ